MYINEYWAKDFEIFSNSKFVFYIIFFLYNSRLAHIKRLSTPKICLYALHVHHENNIQNPFMHVIRIKLKMSKSLCDI